MAAEPWENIVRHLFDIASRKELEGYSDQQLLRCYVDQRDELAFGALVRRHGKMVWGICWRVLGHCQDTEDAFQATFTALIRKAASSQWRESLDGWLHNVAYRMATKAKVEYAQRRAREKRRAMMRREASENAEGPWELSEVFDRELTRLPEKYRSPLILCYLQGLTQEQAARRLNISLRSFERHLAEGRERLRERLSKRGMDLETTMMFAGLSPGAALQEIPPGLIEKTLDIARVLIQTNGVLETAGISIHVATLVKTGLGIWTLKSKICLGFLLLTLAGVSAGAVKYSGFFLPFLRGEPQNEDKLDLVEKSTANTRVHEMSPRTDRYGDPLPEGAMARLGTKRLRVNTPWGFNSLVFTPDGKKVVIAEYGKKPPGLWDLTSGRLLRRFGHRHDAQDYVVALSGDGCSLAVASRTENSKIDLCLWEVATGKLLRQIETEAKGAAVVAFAPDGKTVAAAGDGLESDFGVWCVANGKPVWKKKSEGGIHFINYSLDGNTLIWVQRARVCFGEVATGKEFRHWEDQDNREIGSCDFSPDGRLVAVTFNSVGTFNEIKKDSVTYLLDATSGKKLHQLVDPKNDKIKNEGQGVELAKSVFKAVAFSPDSKVLATGNSHGRIYLWDVATGQTLRRCQGESAGCPRRLAFSPNGKVLASGTIMRDQTVHLWEVATGREITPSFAGHLSGVSSVMFAPNGKEILSMGMDGSLRIWDVRQGTEQLPWSMPHDSIPLLVTPGSISADGRFVSEIIRGNDKNNPLASFVRIRQLGTDKLGKEIRCFQIPEPILFSAIFSPNSKFVVCFGIGNRNSCGHLFEVATGKELCSFVGKSVAFSPDNKTMVVHVDQQEPTIWDVEKGTMLATFPAGKEVGSMTFSPDGHLLAAMCEGKVKLWILPSRQGMALSHGSCYMMAMTCPLDRASKPAFSPDGKILAVVDAHGIISLRETTTGKERRRFQGHSCPIWSLAFSPDGRQLASGSADTTILLWDVTGRSDSQERLRPVHLTAKQIKRLWDDLANPDAMRANQAMWSLIAADEATISFLQRCLRPTKQVLTAEALSQLIVDLDADDFVTRQKSRKQLEDLGEIAEPELRRALEKKVSVEVRRSLQHLLGLLDVKRTAPSGNALRELRVIEVLEQIGTREARQLLEVLNSGAPCNKTQEAGAALRRLNSKR